MNIFCPEPCVACPPIPVGGEGIFPNPNAESNPFNNFSSEKPDVNLFFASNFGGGGTVNPPLGGGTFLSTGCIGLCVSGVSQEDADICAFNQKAICDSVNWPVGPVNPDLELCRVFPSDPSCQPAPRPLFGNDASQCTATCPDGTQFTVTVQANRFLQFTKAQANDIALSYACQQAEAGRMCMSELTPSTACVDGGYDGRIVVTGGVATTQPFVFSLVSGSLPAGMVLSQVNNRTASITGVVTAIGSSTFSIRVTHPNGVSVTRQYTIVAASIDTTSLPDGDVGTAYSVVLTASGTTGTVTWFINSGVLPDGLSLNSETGEISGTPTTEQSRTFNVNMRNGEHLCTKTYTLEITQACPALQATINTSGVGITAAKDAAVFRAINPIGVSGFDLIDTSNNTIIVTDVVTPIGKKGCYSTASSRFVFTDINGDVQTITTAGAVLAPVTPSEPAISVPVYDTVNDRAWFCGQNGGTGEIIFFVFNPANGAIAGVTLGIGVSIPNRVFQTPSPHRAFVRGVTGSDIIDVFDFPALAPAGTVDLSAGGFAKGGIYASSTTKLYLTGYDPVAPFNAQMYEVNPTTLAIDFTFDLGAQASFFDIPLDYNPTTDRIYATVEGTLVTINPTARTVVCTVNPGTVAGGFVSVDTASQSILTNNTASDTLVFHH